MRIFPEDHATAHLKIKTEVIILQHNLSENKQTTHPKQPNPQNPQLSVIEIVTQATSHKPQWELTISVFPFWLSCDEVKEVTE